MEMNGIRTQYNNFFDIRFQLFEHCNLSCKFCSETEFMGIRNNQYIDPEYMRSLPGIVFHTFNNKIDPSVDNIISLCFMGGELFSDDIPDDIFDEYYHTITDITKQFEQISPDSKISHIFLTNGVYRKYQRVLDIVNHFSAKITFSYDFVGRFTSNYQKLLWNKNVQTCMHSNIDTRISLVLSKPNINYILSNGIPFDRNLIIVTHDYVPRLDYQEYLPSDDDLFNFYKWCIDHLEYKIPLIDTIVSPMLSGELTDNYCMTTNDYIFNKKYINKYNSTHICQCSDIPCSAEEYYGNYGHLIDNHCNCLGKKYEIGLQKRGCFTCEHFKYCPKMCWTQILFQHYPLGECPIKRIYEYISRDSELISRMGG